MDVIEADAVEGGTARKVEVEGHEFLVVRLGDDVFITDARCPHLNGDLSRGTLEDSVVTCPRHGSQFDVRDGSVVRWTNLGDALRTVASIVRHPRPLRTYEVEVVDGMVRVGGERPAAQTSKEASGDG